MNLLTALGGHLKEEVFLKRWIFFSIDLDAEPL